MGRALRMPAVALLTLLSAVSCGSAERGPEEKGPACAVSRKTEPVTARFPSFGPLRSASWCGYPLGGGDGDRLGPPGPTDVRFVGLFEAVDEKAVRRDLDDPALRFEAATPPADLPAEVRALLPAGAEWRASARVDATIAADSGRFYYDRRSGRVLFDCVNPRRQDASPAPAQ
ncbi:hypothetical protein [Streptomyces tritici]|uniref:hypothetical protein n=1 Tax=Streptomyces tritici TaxID=2054410 RepID=UPI003AEF4CBA